MKSGKLARRRASRYVVSTSAGYRIGPHGERLSGSMEAEAIVLDRLYNSAVVATFTRQDSRSDEEAMRGYVRRQAQAVCDVLNDLADAEALTT